MRPDTGLVAIPYTIHAYSSYSSTYAPSHILTNTPSSAKSRWSASSGSSVQSLTLCIPPPYVLRMVIFGKYRERHVCNVKEYTLEVRSDDAGDDEAGWVEVVNGGLRNDTIAEWVEIDGWWARAAQPVRYLKIIPRAAHGVNYNYSVWYIELRGVCDPEIYSRCFADARLLRQRKLSTALAIAAELGGWETPQEYEGEEGDERAERESMGDSSGSSNRVRRRRRSPMGGLCGGSEGKTTKMSERLALSRMFARSLVHGDYDNARNILKQVASLGLFAEPFWNTSPSLFFERVADGGCDVWPPGLGGHQMCADKKRNRLWVFGGYDGSGDTDSLWFYECKEGRWSEIRHRQSRSAVVNGITDLEERTGTTQTEGGISHAAPSSSTNNTITTTTPMTPTTTSNTANTANTINSRWEHADDSVHVWPPACSCHRMVYAPISDILVVFGAFFSQSRDELPSVWLYHINSNEWEEVKGSQPWPIARYDHQMVMVPDSNSNGEEVVYVMGGTTHGVEDGGLWRFDLPTRAFTQIVPRDVSVSVADSDCATATALPSGYGMTQCALVPFAGPECLAISSHLLSYQMKETAVLNIETGARRPILGNSAVSPPIAATLRCVLLPSRNILAFSGLQYTLRPTNQLWDPESCSVWHFNTHKFKWKRLCVIGGGGLGTPGKPRFDLPDAREAGGGQAPFRACPAESSFGSSAISALAPSREHLKGLIQRSALTAERKRLGVPTDLCDFGEAPAQRFAHQLAMVDETTAYLYGGNPSVPGEANSGRLNDLWRISIAIPRPATAALCFEYLLTRVEAVAKVSCALSEPNETRAELIEHFLGELKGKAGELGLDIWGEDVANVVRALMGTPDLFAREIVASEMMNSGNVLEAMQNQLAVLFCETMGVAGGEDLWDYM